MYIAQTLYVEDELVNTSITCVFQIKTNIPAFVFISVVRIYVGASYVSLNDYCFSGFVS